MTTAHNVVTLHTITCTYKQIYYGGVDHPAYNRSTTLQLPISVKMAFNRSDVIQRYQLELVNGL